LKFADIDTLPLNLRIQVAVMAWFRADLLIKDELARESANKVLQLVPAKQATVDQYLNAENPLL